MDFELTREQVDIQRAAREFAEGEFKKEIAVELELKHEFPQEIWKKACRLGFAGIHFPQEYGGQGMGVFENILIVEEFCKKDSGIGVALSLGDFASELILRFGTNAQKKKYLEPITGGNFISAGAFTEPDHGSDITCMSTRALKDGDCYIINGTKTFVTNGQIANFATVLCQTDAEVSPSYRGQSLIIVEKDAEGLESADIGEKMGIKMSPTGEYSFSNVKIPVENLVGKENNGFYHALEFFDESRIEIAAQAVGIADGAFQRALDYSKKREQFGKKIASFQITQHKLAEMATKIETARLLTYKAAWNFDRGKIDPKLTSMAKFYSARIAVEVCDEAVQILGGYGYILDQEVERFYRDAKITEIYEGTKEIQKNTIASCLIGKIK